MTIAVVQAVAKSALTSTITATGGPNNALFVAINSFNGSGSSSVTSVKIGTSSLALASSKILSNAGTTSSFIYYLGNIPSGQTAIAIVGSGLNVDTADGGVDIIEVSGLPGATLDKAPTPASGTGLTWSSGSSGTLTVPNEFVLGTADILASGNPSGWTLISGGGSRRTGYKIVSATTAQTFNSTMSSSNDWTALITSFMAGAAGNSAAAAVASML